MPTTTVPVLVNILRLQIIKLVLEVEVVVDSVSDRALEVEGNMPKLTHNHMSLGIVSSLALGSIGGVYSEFNNSFTLLESP